jgi:hypothetical protein
LINYFARLAVIYELCFQWFKVFAVFNGLNTIIIL